MTTATLEALRDGLVDGTFDDRPEARSLFAKLNAEAKRERRIKFVIWVCVPAWILAACLGLTAHVSAARPVPAPAATECVETPAAPNSGMRINPCADLDPSQVEDHRGDAKPKVVPVNADNELGWVRCTGGAKKVCAKLAAMGYETQTRPRIDTANWMLVKYGDFVTASRAAGF